MVMQSVPLGVAILILISFVSSSGYAAPSCGALPISKLQVLSQQTSGIEEYSMSRNEMDRLAAKLGASKTDRQTASSADVDGRRDRGTRNGSASAD